MITGSTLSQWINAALEGNPADPIGYARFMAETNVRAGKHEEASVWKAVIEHLQDEFAKPLPRPQDNPGPDDDSSSVF